jgi:hypothetical protein
METIERVLFNPFSGKLAIGIRLRFMDKYHGEDLSLGAFGEDSQYELKIEPGECDAWAIDNEDGIWIVVVTSLLEKAGIEDLGPL